MQTYQKTKVKTRQCMRMSVGAQRRKAKMAQQVARVGTAHHTEYPADWDPQTWRQSNWRPLIKHPLETARDIGDTIAEVGEPSNKKKTSTMGRHLQLFDLGIEGLDDVMDDVVMEVQEDGGEVPGFGSFVEDNVLAVVEDDVGLFKDAPPVRDNINVMGADQRNMDLRLAADAVYIGKIYANKKEMHKFLSLYAMKRLFSFKFTKSDRKRVIAKCVDKNCDWRIYAIIHPDSENLEVRTVNLKHSCDVEARSRYREKATSKVLADLLQSKYVNGKKGPRACELPDIVLAELKVTISYMKAWNAKEMAISAARGDEEASYRFITTYLHLLRTTNPGTKTALQTSKDKMGCTRFKYLFFAMGASIEGYRYMRKVVVIDGTQMKGKYKGCLVAACGQDGNLLIYPLAFGVVDGENELSWVWFFENLKDFVADEEDLVFVSDRHAAIYAAIRKVYPLAHHGACAVHLWRNVNHRYKSASLAGVVAKAARAYTIGDFRYWWDEIKSRSPKCAEYLQKIGLPHWTLSHFPCMSYNLMSSNISESLNTAMSKAVDYPIMTMIEFIRALMMEWFACRRTKGKKVLTRCTPEIEDMLVDNLEEATACAVLTASEFIYQVNDASGCVFTVNLEKKTCTCRMFDVMLVPCSHALAARCVLDIDIYSLVGDCYKIDKWKKLYENVIMPVPRVSDVYIPT